MSAMSLTFGDVAENHKGMQKIGKMSDRGFSLDDLLVARGWFESHGCQCDLIDLRHDLLVGCSTIESEYFDVGAWILTAKGAVNALLEDRDGADKLMAEQAGLTKDTKAFMYGRVVNKHARHNLCFADEHQEANYEAGMGTVYAFSETPYLAQIRHRLSQITSGIHGTTLQTPFQPQFQAEGNYYYNVQKCGIGYHGDAERKKVIALRLGSPIPLCFRWYHRNKQVSPTRVIDTLEHGDLYIMSEKATGFDWKSSSKYTLRHAAGCNKFVLSDPL